MPRPFSLAIHQTMNLQLVNLSEAIRDMRGEIVISYLKPDDATQLRNLIQAVIRDIMAVKPDGLFEQQRPGDPEDGARNGQQSGHIVVELEPTSSPGSPGGSSFVDETEAHLKVVRDKMEGPARDLISAMTDMLVGCDAELMKFSGQEQLLGASSNQGKPNLQASKTRLDEVMSAFDESDVSLIDHPELPSTYSGHPELVELFLFIHPLRQTADSIQELATKVIEMTRVSRSMRLFLPSYPLQKALYRTNPQVRHDRGGVTAGSYFRSKQTIEEVMGTFQGKPFIPSPNALFSEKDAELEQRQVGNTGVSNTAEPRTLRHMAWKILHRLQQFETRFAFKVVFVTIVLSMPGWAGNSRRWYVENECWWSVVAAWFMMHPRVGGSAQDLVTRSVVSAAGVVWAGLGYAAGNGSPYILALFAAVFMLPCSKYFIYLGRP